jgi:hypothetical protein
MRRVSLRWCVVWAMVVGVVGLPGVFAATVGDTTTGPPTWQWTLSDSMPQFSQLIISNNPGIPWTESGAFSHSEPANWTWIGNATAIAWMVPVGMTGAAGPFSVTPVGTVYDVQGAYTLNGIGGGSGSLNHVPATPEASTIALFAVGLLALPLYRWRKREDAGIKP